MNTSDLSNLTTYKEIMAARCTQPDRVRLLVQLGAGYNRADLCGFLNFTKEYLSSLFSALKRRQGLYVVDNPAHPRREVLLVDSYQESIMVSRRKPYQPDKPAD